MVFENNTVNCGSIKMAASTLSIAASIRMHSSTATLLLVSVIFCLFQCFILLDQTPDLYFLLFIGLFEFLLHVLPEGS